MKKALSLLGFSLALSCLITACGSEPQRPARGGGDAAIGPRGPTSGPQNTNTMVCAPGSFQGGNDCIPVKVAGCPAGMIQQGAECVCPAGMLEQGGLCVCPAGTTLQNNACVAPPPPKKVEMAAIPPMKLDLEFGELIDPRNQWRSPRARQLLITEIQGLEALFQSTPKDSPDRPKLIARLALGYVELESAVMAPGPAGEEYVKRQKMASAARRVAMKDYLMLVNQYPKYCAKTDAGKSTGCIDEILYFLALEYLRDSDPSHARSTLMTLIKDWPSSDKVGHAYFIFGEMLRDEAPTNPSYWDTAEKTFAKAATIKGPMQEAAKARVALVKKERDQKTTQVAAP